MDQTKLTTGEEAPLTDQTPPNPRDLLVQAMESLRPKAREMAVTLPTGLKIVFRTVKSRKEYSDVQNQASFDAKKAKANPTKWIRALVADDPAGIVHAGLLFRLQLRVEDADGVDLGVKYTVEDFYQFCAEDGIFFDNMFNMVLMANLGNEITSIDDEVNSLVDFSEETVVDSTIGSEPLSSTPENSPGNSTTEPDPHPLN